MRPCLVSVLCYLALISKKVPIILRELVLCEGFNVVSPSFTVREVTIELFEPRLTYRTMMYLHMIDP